MRMKVGRQSKKKRRDGLLSNDDDIPSHARMKDGVNQTECQELRNWES